MTVGTIDIDALKRERAGVVAEMRALNDKAEAENRDLSEEESKTWAEKRDHAKALQNRIEREQETRGEESRYASKGPKTQPDPDDDPRIGMGDDEIEQYSLVRAIRAAASGDWREAGLEREASEAVQKKTGKEPRGFFVPHDFLNRRDRRAADLERRDLNKTTATAGGHTIDTLLLSQSFIDMLRNALVVERAGASLLTGLVGDIAIPRQTGGGTAYWVAESGNITEGQQAFDQVAMAPKSVGAFTDISRKLLLQSSLDIEAFVRRDLATTLAIEIDRAALHGSGAANQPTGIASTAGIGSVAGGANGLAPTYGNIVTLETEVAQDNAAIGGLSYVTNTKVRGKLKQTEKASSTAIFVWGEGAQPLNGYPALVSNQVSSTLTKGTSVGVCSAIFFGNWADLLIGMWGGLDILVDPYTGGIAGTVRVIAFQDVDIAVRHAESFAAMLDALTV